MPTSEAHLDAAHGDLRVRIVGFTDAVCGVRFVAGEALDPMPPRTLARLRGIGVPVEVVGPWESAPSTQAPTEPVTTSEPPLSSAPDADDTPTATPAPKRRK